jgi:hemolysin activation/secretion protein
MSLRIIAGRGRWPLHPFYSMSARMRDTRTQAPRALSAFHAVCYSACAAGLFSLVAPNVLAQAPPAPAAQAAAATQPEENHFDVFEYRVLGNTVLPTQAVERAVYPHLGEKRTLKDVEGARLALEQAYKEAGFGTVFVDIPEQDVDQGIVRLKVTEGKLNRVKIENARYFSARRIREALPAAEKQTVPALPELQKQIAAFNAETPDRTIVPVLGAGAMPGTVDLTLKVDDHLPFHGSLEVNNQYTENTSKLRALASVSYDNLFNRLDSLSLQYQTAPKEPNEFGVFAANFLTHIGSSDHKLAFYYVHSDSDVALLAAPTSGATGGPSSVLGKGQVFGGRWIIPLENTAAATHTFTAGFDYKDFLENILFTPEPGSDPTLGSDLTTLQTPITYLNLSLGSTSVWRGERQQWTLTSSANFGPRRLTNNDGEFADKRFKARPNYFYVRADASSRTLLPKQFSLLVRLAGQYAVEPVIGNEQFTIGGADGPRGYLEAAELGDYGVKGTVQLGSPPWQIASGLFRIEGFAFYDAGIVVNIAPQEEVDRPRIWTSDLTSWGLGVNIAAFENALAALSWAQALTDSGHTLSGDSRLLFTVRWAW